MTDHRSKDSFFEELERAAKGLSVVTDQASSEELRRLFSELQGEAPAGEEAGTTGRDAVEVCHETIEIRQLGRAEGCGRG